MSMSGPTGYEAKAYKNGKEKKSLKALHDEYYRKIEEQKEHKIFDEDQVHKVKLKKLL
jgi:hypothetical protein